MSYSYFGSSTQVQMYPSAYRGYKSGSQYNPEAKLSTEYNVTTLSYKVAKRNFVISKNYAANGDFEFSIKGYYFKFKNFVVGSFVPSGSTELWAKIRVTPMNPTSDPTNVNYPGYTLVNITAQTEQNRTPLDVNDVFNGVEFFESQPSTYSGSGHTSWDSTTDYELRLLVLDTTWKVPESSRLTVDSTEVLGGVLDGTEKSLSTYLKTTRIDADTLNLKDAHLTNNLQVDKNARIEGTANVKDTFTSETKAVLKIVEVSGTIASTNTTESNATTSGALVLAGGLGIAKNANIGGKANITGDTTISGITKVTNATDSTAVGNGAMVISGGLSVGKKTNLGGNTFVKGTFTVGSTGSLKQSTFNGDVDVIGGNVYTDKTIYNDQVKFGADAIANEPDYVGLIRGSIRANADVHAKGKLISGTPGSSSATGDGALRLYNRSKVNKTTTLRASTSTNDRTIDLPDLSGTIALIDQPQSWTGSQSFRTQGANLYFGGTSNANAAGYIYYTGAAKFNGIYLTGGITVPTNSNLDIGSNTARLRTIYATSFNGLATKAAADESGNNIKSNYGHSLGQIDPNTVILLNANGAQLDAEELTIDYVEHMKIGSNNNAGDSTTPVYFVGGVPTALAYSYNQNLKTNSSVNFASVTASGQIKADNFYATSDRRLKENIKTYNSKKSILDLPIYEYDYKDSKEHTIGCMAQDVQEMFPELVKTDENGFLSIAESKLIYLLLNEVKQLKQQLAK